MSRPRPTRCDLAKRRRPRRVAAIIPGLLCLFALVPASAGWASEADPLPVCPDGDQDGYAVCTDTCDSTDLLCGDCKDAAELIHPAATELCDFIDNNCDGTIDEDLPVGRESFASAGYDCLDEADNDADGLIDLDDLDCVAAACSDPDPPGCVEGDRRAAA